MAKSETISIQKEKIDTEKFKKGNLISSDRYADKRDIVSALLEEDKEYTLSEVDKLVETFMKGKVE